MKNIALILLGLMSLQLFAQSQKEEDLIFCEIENKENLEVKLTKTHDQLYSLYVSNKTNSRVKWEKIMDLDEPVVWTKNGVGEVADFYSYDGYNYWLRLFFNNSYEATGNGEFLIPQPDDETGEQEPEKIIVKDCRGRLK
jgi:hypothetical protein